MLYFVHLMDNLVNSLYVIVYVHTMSTGENQPSSACLKHLYHALDNRYVLVWCSEKNQSRNASQI